MRSYLGCHACAGSVLHSSARSLMDSACSEFDRHKWCLPTIRTEDVEICRYPDGKPVELGRGGFCKVQPHLHAQSIRSLGIVSLLLLQCYPCHMQHTVSSIALRRK